MKELVMGKQAAQVPPLLGMGMEAGGERALGLPDLQTIHPLHRWGGGGGKEQGTAATGEQLSSVLLKASTCASEQSARPAQYCWP